ncbi:MAG TPA: Asp-tRNA(Asn)/Glu-tRNA(Gln) amidotransferase subunit GatB [Deltaproteobacteria bacterium]|nr:Asp-tRNA(Asn)/Glu-tRNA(Gln) amidotransferase subunit GatB [Deltaproteobacteria bacterium]
MRDFEVVIGLEVHAQLRTQSKIFCSCSTVFGLEPNTNTCEVCLGMPGVLPVLNRAVVDCGIKLGLATGCSVEPVTVFARKNYFYPDLPKGYQITQYDHPLCSNGHLDIEVGGEKKRIGIVRIHMEEDAGKTIHDEDKPLSFIDFNRAGVPLLEIVSRPDLRSSSEAVEYLKVLRLLLMYLEICDGNMEEGSFRCDANVSVKPVGQQVLGIRTELKNMNSFRNVHKALDYEVRRQIELLAKGDTVVQETRLWNAALNESQPMRSKEESHDYRYFPEPDLVPVVVDEAWIDEIRATLPELPSDKRARFATTYGLPSYDTEVLTQSRALADFFEQCVEILDSPKDISNWIMTEVLHVLKVRGKGIGQLGLGPPEIAGLLALIREGTLSGTLAKEVFSEMVASGRDAHSIVSEKGLEQLSDKERIREAIEVVLNEHPKEVARYRGGKTQLLGFFVGQVMKATRGKANPNLTNTLIREMLDS